MLIYHHHRLTGVYVGASQADPDPMELELARRRVSEPLALAAAAQRDLAVSAAIARFDQVAAEEGVSAEEIAAAAAVRDLDMVDAATAADAALQAAGHAASMVEAEHWLIPAHATTTPPPAFGFDQQAVWAEGEWTVVSSQAEEAVEAPDPDPEEIAAVIRVERTRRIAAVRWLVDRHRDELDLERPPTLSSDQFRIVLQHIQDLRDLPEQPEFPLSTVWPQPPEFL